MNAKDLDVVNCEFSKWVACWGNATSITDRKECVYAKDITLRYPIRMCFSGNKLRLHFSNLTGTEPVTLSKVFVRKSPLTASRGGRSVSSECLPVLFNGQTSVTIPPGNAWGNEATPLRGGEEAVGEVSLDIMAGETIEVSIYLGECTQMNAGTLITGPLSKGRYAYGDFAESAELPMDLSRNTNWFYFLNTIDIFTEEKNHAIVCYGDSITAQSWPDYLTLRAEKEGYDDVSIIRRAVSGTRILRQYGCITYQAYGLKGATRFPIEMNVAGASDVIIQHGINDIIHPVGVEVNPFRPWSDMPTCEELQSGVEQLYVQHASQLGLRVWSGTLLPIEGWRTYSEERDKLRCAFNEWLRTSPLFDGCIDFDEAVRDAKHPAAFALGFDSGDHLHPSEKAYEAMAACVPLDAMEKA